MDYNGYMKVHYDTIGYFNGFNSDNPSVIGRIASLLTNALTTRPDCKLLPLPKLIMIVLDDDVIKTIGDYSKNVTKAFARILNYIMTEYDRAVATFKESLPAKCVCTEGFPSFLSIKPPSHDKFINNSLHYKSNKALDEAVPLHPNMYTLELKKVWDSKDLNLYHEAQHFTVSGFKAYWEADDKTTRYLDSVILKKNDWKVSQKMHKRTGFIKNEQFRWQNPRLNQLNVPGHREYK